MLVVSKIRRPGGTVLRLFGATVHFKPIRPEDPESPHVADVDPQAHPKVFARLIGLTEGYAPYDESMPSGYLPDEPPSADDVARRVSAAPIERPTPVEGAAEGASNIASAELSEAARAALAALPNFTDPAVFKNRKAIVEWAAGVYPQLALNQKLPEGRIVELIRQHVVSQA